MDRDLFNKLQQERTLEGADALILEAGLESESNLSTAAWVKSMNDPEPSLAWRSSLNQKLSAFNPPVRIKNSFRWLGAVAVGSAACLAAVLLYTAKFDGAPNQSATPDRMVSAELSNDEFGMVLVGTHAADEAQLSLGIQPPRRPAEGGRFDWESIR